MPPRRAASAAANKRAAETEKAPSTEGESAPKEVPVYDLFKKKPRKGEPTSVVEPATESAASSSSGFTGELVTLPDYSILENLKDEGWRRALEPAFKKPYFKAIVDFLENEKKLKKEIFPLESDIFSAFNYTPLDKVKVVIIGQDPYHDNGQAHGLCFSVLPGIKPPPSLVNIYKEMVTDLPGFKAPSHGCLVEWALEGVLLLNATLTVQAHTPNSHAKCGWQEFTDAVIRTISDKKSDVIFLLWGGFAQKKEKIINSSKHVVIKGAHPSPLSVTKWWGCKHFSQTNRVLESKGRTAIRWSLSEDVGHLLHKQTS